MVSCGCSRYPLRHRLARGKTFDIGRPGAVSQQSLLLPVIFANNLKDRSSPPGAKTSSSWSSGGSRGAPDCGAGCSWSAWSSSCERPRVFFARASCRASAQTPQIEVQRREWPHHAVLWWYSLSKPDRVVPRNPCRPPPEIEPKVLCAGLFHLHHCS